MTSGDQSITAQPSGSDARRLGADSHSRMTRYVWLVLLSAFFAWMFDSIALNVFTLILTPSMSELLQTDDRGTIAAAGGLIVAIKLVAWGIGGTIFGVLTDRFGRARIMLVTIVIYALFTGLSALAQNWEMLAVCQAITGLGIGGEWAAGAAMLAEVLPERLRPTMMIIMQLAFSVGFFFLALLNLAVGTAGWRWLLVWCAIPAILVIVLRLFVKEPERWVDTRRGHRHAMGSLRRLFAPELRKSTIGGVCSAAAMMVGAFAATTFLPSWIAELSSSAVQAGHDISYFAMLLNVGAIVGYLVLIWLTQTRLGRRGSFFIYCLGSLVTAIAMFTLSHSTSAILFVTPIVGFFMLGGFGVFAIYLPELFPTSVRATGQGFCFNFARIITGVGTLTTGLLVGALGSFPMAGLLVSLAFAFGLFTIWISPETRGWRLRDN